MNKDEIKKALECCCGDDDHVYCNSCPYVSQACCRDYMAHGALDLINEQEKENELLKMQLQDAVNHANTFLEEANKFETENKRLGKEIDFQVQDRERLQREIDELEQAHEQRVEEIEQLKAENKMRLINLSTAQDQILETAQKNQEYHEQQIKQAKIDVLNKAKKCAVCGAVQIKYIDQMIEELKK